MIGIFAKNRLVNRKFLTPSYFTLYLITAVIFYSLFNIKPWKNADDNKEKSLVINNDVVSYYAYLPAFFIHDDLQLNFTETDKIDYHAKCQFWPEKSPNGGKVIKTTMGMSFLYSPFFIAGHIYAINSHHKADGFSKPYEFFLTFSCLFYLTIGIIFLRKILLRTFSEWVTSITLICLVFGTHLYYYSTTEATMSHAYNFSLIACFIYYTFKWHEQQKLFYTILLGILGGLIVLIRPVNIILFLLPFLYNVKSLNELKEKTLFFIGHWKHLLVIAVLVLLVISPQLFYWKYVTGDWFFNSYVGEKFYFGQPHIMEFLFSYRKGWLLYTPIMLLSIIGIILSYKGQKNIFFGLSIILGLNIYILSSWWSWWYGGSFGMRPMIDVYALLAIPFALSIQWIIQRHIFLKIITGWLILYFINLNLFQTAQKRHNVLHWDSMTKDAYWTNFNKLRMKTANDWHILEKQIQPPDYEAAKKGIDEYNFDPF